MSQTYNELAQSCRFVTLGLCFWFHVVLHGAELWCCPLSWSDAKDSSHQVFLSRIEIVLKYNCIEIQLYCQSCIKVKYQQNKRTVKKKCIYQNIDASDQHLNFVSCMPLRRGQYLSILCLSAHRAKRSPSDIFEAFKVAKYRLAFTRAARLCWFDLLDLPGTLKSLYARWFPIHWHGYVWSQSVSSHTRGCCPGPDFGLSLFFLGA